MLEPCNPCICSGAQCEQCMFGYQSAEANHKQMKRLIELVDSGEKPNGFLLAQRYKDIHSDWKKQMEDSNKRKENIKLEGRILLFNHVNKNNDIFPDNCKIVIPEKVPLLWEFHHGEVIGVAEVTKDDKGLVAKADIFSDNFIDVDIEDILSDGKIGVGGFYNKVKKHNEGHFIIVNEATLRETSLTLAPVCDEYYFEIVKEGK